MQLLHGSPVSVPQFASLSILVKQGMAEPLTTLSHTATVSREAAMEAIRELHCHIKSILRSQETDDLTSELLREDEKYLKTVQIFRPLAANGLGLHYRLLHGNSETAKLQTLILASKKSSPGKIDPSSGVLGVIMCVAVTGSSAVHCTSSIPYCLPQRMSDCAGYLLRLSDVASAMALLTTFLLMDDEYRITNKMMEAPNLLLLPESDDRARGGVLSPMGMISPIAEFGRKTARLRNVMNAGAAAGAAMSPQEAPIVETGFPLSLDLGSADAARAITDRLTVLSVAEKGTFLRKYEHSGQERKANLDLMGGSKSRFRRRKGDARDADFDNFDYKGPVKGTVKQEYNAIPPLQPTPEPAVGKPQLRSSTKDTKRGPGTRRLSANMERYDDENSSYNQHSHAHMKNSFDLSHQQKKGRLQFDDETHDSRSQSGHQDTSSVLSQTRIQVNIAVNEDLTCSYKLSQLSSCNVEGVVQVQVKTPARASNIPFSLLIRDPSLQIDTLNENKKVAENVSASLKKQSQEKSIADYKFNLAIPKQEAYVPLLKYKCSGDLRPVPIRVQTKVKVDGGFCRVALQISSNPNNNASLSDLTIVMGVPDMVPGETLATQPAGGVWDESKSTVIWCVSELGSGEKFQLQARFEMENDAVAANELNFPVLVRCLCLNSQLSDIDFEVIDNPDEFPAEFAMKLARRYRLSHREKNG